MRLSKLLARVLRHRPEAAGVSLDSQGWCPVDDLLAGMVQSGISITRHQLFQVVAWNDKGRFVLSDDGTNIRACQGHSVSNVRPVLRPKKPPSVLFHGTSATALPNVLKHGLLPMRRHHVHLSQDCESAKKVGMRHGPPVVLRVASFALAQTGVVFLLSDNDVWLVDHVPPQYLSLVD
ncbi:RNA 2'-phosphotransferase [Pelomonas sp. SE-A7]|uniref:RNA 2'-phosphotransferase n=1 Tax=Pelomonas sp. SE-A7 TaxID=3054953 RepID=UPI00259CEEC3|nr:RNA 2'-phosphotransferase [Pelomonas sp. SE-A7]MDM4765965.1 RNA 2'-phosphotransferase [Pelomonas sp. SE-A7]